MEGLGSAASVIAVIDLWVKVASQLLQYSEEVKEAKEDITSAQLQVEGLRSVCESVRRHLDSPDGGRLATSQNVRDALNYGLSKLLAAWISGGQVTTGPRAHGDETFCFRALKWPFDSKYIERTLQHLDTYTNTISLALVGARQAPCLPTALLSTSLTEGVAPTCHRDTRVNFLRRIHEWADRPEDQTQIIFRLNGMAGTGKSTISRTIARHLADIRRLGAGFFFTRGDGDRGKVTKHLTTIAGYSYLVM
ncbi:hypothetical protein VTK73DRAFT_7150 [Phialemonium thermophilum]|uniref:Nephrocystin 3-like N-terminal domain-containing protein n=1 Tax=Phialemonium thermophilum TaxID=223376 RepID=A0ABR3WGF4_9PEZI